MHAADKKHESTHSRMLGVPQLTWKSKAVAWLSRNHDKLSKGLSLGSSVLSLASAVQRRDFTAAYTGSVNLAKAIKDIKSVSYWDLFDQWKRLPLVTSSERISQFYCGLLMRRARPIYPSLHLREVQVYEVLVGKEPVWLISTPGDKVFPKDLIYSKVDSKVKMRNGSSYLWDTIILSRVGADQAALLKDLIKLASQLFLEQYGGRATAVGPMLFESYSDFSKEPWMQPIGLDVPARRLLSKPGRTLLVVGPRGTGKTRWAQSLPGSSITIGPRNKPTVDALMEGMLTPDILVIDDADRWEPEILEALLKSLPDMARRGIRVVATANRVSKFPDALLRPGRFDETVRLTMPPLEHVEAVFSEYLGFFKAKPLSKEDVHTLAELLHGLSPCTVKEVAWRISESGTADPDEVAAQVDAIRWVLSQAGGDEDEDEKKNGKKNAWGQRVVYSNEKTATQSYDDTFGGPQ